VLRSSRSLRWGGGLGSWSHPQTQRARLNRAQIIVQTGSAKNLAGPPANFANIAGLMTHDSGNSSSFWEES